MQSFLDTCGGLRGLPSSFPPFLAAVQAAVKKQMDAAVVDNDKVYHERIPSAENLKPPERFGKTLAKPLPMGDLVAMTQLRDPFSHVTPVHILDAHNQFKGEVHGHPLCPWAAAELGRAM